MFRAISKRDFRTLISLNSKFLQRRNVTAAFLCIDHVYSAPVPLKNASLKEMEWHLRIFFSYAWRLQQFTELSAPSDHAVIRKDRQGGHRQGVFKFQL